MATHPEQLRMADDEDQLPESQIGRAQWLADELVLCGHEEISAMDILDALASIGLKLMPDMEGTSSHEYMCAHKSVVRSPKADLNYRYWPMSRSNYMEFLNFGVSLMNRGGRLGPNNSFDWCESNVKDQISGGT